MMLHGYRAAHDVDNATCLPDTMAEKQLQIEWNLACPATRQEVARNNEGCKVAWNVHYGPAL